MYNGMYVYADSLVASIHSALTDELRHPVDNPHPLAGFCYVASEAFYHIIGGKHKGLTPCMVKHEGVNHWYIKYKDGTIFDLTADQFKNPPDYDKGRGRGFLTKKPSKRAQIVMDRVAGSMDDRATKD